MKTMRTPILALIISVCLPFPGFAEELAIKGTKPGQSLEKAIDRLAENGIRCAESSIDENRWKAKRLCDVPWVDGQIELIHTHGEFNGGTTTVFEISFIFRLPKHRQLNGDLMPVLSERFGQKGMLSGDYTAHWFQKESNAKATVEHKPKRVGTFVEVQVRWNRDHINNIVEAWREWKERNPDPETVPEF